MSGDPHKHTKNALQKQKSQDKWKEIKLKSLTLNEIRATKTGGRLGVGAQN